MKKHDVYMAGMEDKRARKKMKVEDDKKFAEMTEDLGKEVSEVKTRHTAVTPLYPIGRHSKVTSGK